MGLHPQPYLKCRPLPRRTAALPPSLNSRKRRGGGFMSSPCARLPSDAPAAGAALRSPGLPLPGSALWFRALVPPWNPTRMKPSAVLASPSRPSRATSPTGHSASWRRHSGCTRRRAFAVSVWCRRDGGDIRTNGGNTGTDRREQLEEGEGWRGAATPAH